MLKPEVVELKSQRGVGYYLEIRDIEIFHEMLQSLTKEATEHNENDFNNPNARIQYLLEYLLFSKSYILSDILSQEMALSRSQFTNDCLIVREFIKPFNLKLVSKPRLGIRIEGSEFNRRLCCIANSYFQKIRGNLQDMKETFLTVSENEKLKNIHQIVLRVFENFHYRASDVTIQNLVLHLYISFKRIKLGEKITVDSDILKKLQQTEEYQIAISIYKETDYLFNIGLSDSEIGYITMHLTGKRAYSSNKINEFLIDEKIDALVTRMLANVEANYGIHLQHDMELRLALGLHLIPLLRRIEFGLMLKNPLKEQIKTKITLAYEVVFVHF
ncbi:BglG family transcription antiterminator [Lactococcus laudensis]|uniref:BglG family transcription antiterminator n=1 Tax=Pseudolactococcus laudensis TaxID=1494461 RepID=UPI002FC84C64